MGGRHEWVRALSMEMPLKSDIPAFSLSCRSLKWSWAWYCAVASEALSTEKWKGRGKTMVPKGPQSATVWPGDASNERQRKIMYINISDITIQYLSFLLGSLFLSVCVGGGGVFCVFVVELVSHQFVLLESCHTSRFRPFSKDGRSLPLPFATVPVWPARNSRVPFTGFNLLEGIWMPLCLYPPQQWRGVTFWPQVQRQDQFCTLELEQGRICMALQEDGERKPLQLTREEQVTYQCFKVHFSLILSATAYK